ncbi:MAG: diguanylate cyclase [bacterium]
MDEAIKQKILITDDIPANITVLGEVLREEYEIIIATNGEKALEIAASEDSPDLILLDIMMPGMDGYEVCRRLKEDEKTIGIPVIFITAKNEIDDETRGLDLGAVDYITKPFQIPIVKARVRTHLELKRKNDILENIAALDGLTGIPNRRQFDETVQREWLRCLRQGVPLSLIMMDIDFFKKYNDAYGHTAGDECLRRVALALKSSVRRAADLMARYGGEEFAAILPDTHSEGAAFVAERIRSSVESEGIPHEYSEVADHVTLSVGAATKIPQMDSTASEIIEAADRMLYEAKDGGRNSVRSTDLSEGQVQTVKAVT